MPHNVEAEQQILGALLCNNDLMEAISGLVDADTFFDPVHADLFGRIKARVDAGQLASPVTLRPEAEAMEQLKVLGGWKYLVRMAGAAISQHAIRDYAMLLADLKGKRDLLEVMRDGRAKILDGRAGTASIAADIETGVGKVSVATSTKPLIRSFLSASTGALQQIYDAYQGVKSAGVSTGLPHLDKMLSYMRAGNMILLGARPSMGKAQPLDEPVLTVKGWVPMGSLKVGDELASTDGSPSKITGVFPQGVAKVMRVTFSDGRSTRCSDQHLWTVGSCRFNGLKTVDTIQLAAMINQDRYRNRLWVPMVQGIHGEESTFPLDPWLLGFLLGDGHLATDSVRFSTADPEIVDRVAAVVGETHRVRHVAAYDYAIIGREVGNQILDALHFLRLSGKRSHEKYIPSQFLTADRDTRLNILRGLMDSDGWVESFGSLRFASSSRRLAEEVVYLVRSLGGLATIRCKPIFASEENGGRKYLDSHVVNIRHKDGAMMFTLDRKSDRVKRRFSPNLNVVSVECEGEAEQQCIAVSHPSNLYITRDFIVTHNTTVAQNIAYHCATNGVGVFFGSLEMTGEDLAPRFFSKGLAQRGLSIPYTRIMRGDLTETELREVVEETKRQMALPIIIGERDVREVSRFRMAARRARQQLADTPCPLGLIVVDYVQQMHSKTAKSTYDRASEASDTCKSLAMEFGVPVLALAQLSREVEKREPPIPMLADLRETGKLEEDADVVLFCYRDAYYLQRKLDAVSGDLNAENDLRMQLSQCEKSIDIIVAKQRSGPIGVSRAYIDMATCNLTPDRAEHAGMLI